MIQRTVDSTFRHADLEKQYLKTVCLFVLIVQKNVREIRGNL